MSGDNSDYYNESWSHRENVDVEWDNSSTKESEEKWKETLRQRERDKSLANLRESGPMF